jgi:hypothetical protein
LNFSQILAALIVSPSQISRGPLQQRLSVVRKKILGSFRSLCEIFMGSGNLVIIENAIVPFALVHEKISMWQHHF